MSGWGVPDWRNADAYPKPDELSDRLWRWQFIRRMPDYREAWERASKVEYEVLLDQVAKGLAKFGVLSPDNPYFVVTSTTVYNNPSKYGGLIKYNLETFFNPRVAVPRIIWQDGPQYFDLRRTAFNDERAGSGAVGPKPEPRLVRESIIEPGWTDVKFNLNEPLDQQFGRAATLLKELQERYLQEIGTAEQVRVKAARRKRKNIWPQYLRVLDARDSGTSYEEIGKSLRGIDDCGIAQMAQPAADRLLAMVDRARADAKKWHDAAVRIAIDWVP